MNKKILFSPVGGTDPISQSNCRDGSMLHICRFEKPDTVILYLSKEMVEHEQTDHRYSYCLNKLMELQNRDFEIKMIERPDLVDVQDFDYFYNEFSEIISKIMSEDMDQSDTLILNISSGTPGMKSALGVLKTISEISCRLIQVSTPNKSQNIHDNRGYDPELLWECNEDNNPDAQNRCADVTLPSLAVKKKEEVIKMHVLAYDYHAALQVAGTLPENISCKYIDLLEMASARYNFNLSEFSKRCNSTGYRPSVTGGNVFKRFEYALILQVKLKRKEYADFIRALTPLIVDLFEQVLEKKCGLVVNNYCSKKDGKERRWDRSKLEGTEVLRAFQNYYLSEFKYGNVYSDHLRILIKHFSNDENLKSFTDRLRDVESDVRNLAAHEMDSFDDNKIRNLTGLSANSIMQTIRSYFGFLGYFIPKEAWDSYDIMNESIIRAI